MNGLKTISAKNRILSWLILIIILAVSLVLPLNSQEKEKEALEDLREIYEKNEKVGSNQNPFDELEIKGKSAIVWDIKNQKALYEKKPDDILPLASITKMLLVAVSLDILSPDTAITIENDFLEAEGDTGLLLKEQWLLKDLLKFSLIESSNDGARAIASAAGAAEIGTQDYELGREEFIRLMNQKARQWGTTNTTIMNETGLDLYEQKSQSGAYGSARDVALIFENLLKKYPEALEATKESDLNLISLSNIPHFAKNTNRKVNSIPGITASKTGYTDLAGGNLAIIFDPSIGHPIAIVVLGSTFEERFTDTLKMVQATREYLINQKTRHQYTNLNE